MCGITKNHTFLELSRT